MFYRTERYEDAIAILDDLALEFPDSKHVLYALTKCFFKVGRFQEARELCHELITKHQDDRAETLLKRMGDRKDTYTPQPVSHEAPPELPVGAATGDKDAHDSPSGIQSPSDDTTSSWLSSTPTGLFSSPQPPAESHSSGGEFSTPSAEHTTPFSTPPPLPKDEPLVTPPSLPKEEDTKQKKKQPSVEAAPQTFSIGRKMFIAAAVIAAVIVILFFAFAPRQFLFPEDHSLGTIIIREVHGSKVKWTNYDEATGQVSIPKRTYIGLRASKDLTEADLILLQKASWLKHLDLSQSEITDDMVEYIAELRQVRTIDVRGTGLTQTGITRLREYLPPKCRVLFDVNASAKAGTPKPNPPPPEPATPATSPPPPASPPAADKPETPPAPEEQPPGPRDLVFTELVGDLFIRAWDAPPDTAWRPYKTAKSHVAVSAGQVVKLAIRVGSSQFDALRHLKPDDIHTMDVSAMRLEDEAVPYVARLTGLQVLHADKADISNAGIEGLCALSELRELTLAGADDFDAAGMTKLPALKKLERLVLRGTNVADDSLRHIGKLPNLRYLDLTRTKISDTGLAHLTNLDALTELALSYTRVKGPGIAHLKSLDALERLDLDGNSVSTAGLAALAQCKHLQYVQLDGASITDKTLMTLAKAPALNQVHLINTRVTPEGVNAFKQASPKCSVLATGTQAP